MMRFTFLPAAALLAVPLFMPTATAATSTVLPAWVCSHPDSIYASQFEAAEPMIPHDPSAGGGGDYPGAQTRTLYVAGLGSGAQSYYIYVPAAYTPTRPWPLLLALHGVAPYGSADSYATTIRNNWIAAAEAGGFIVAAPVANEIYYQNGAPYAVTWMVPPTSGPNDYDLFAAIRADLESAYNVERTRIYGWGFSAGGHVMHDLAVNGFSDALNVNTMAAYGVSAGDLAALACYGISSTVCGQHLAALPRKIPLDIHIGNSDPNYAYAKADRALFEAEGWVRRETIYYNTFSGGHEYTIAQLSDIWGNLCPQAVTP
jgi:hypothetical protein